MNKKFAIIGVGGYIAPRHLKAIKETGNDVVAALDKNDSVGIIDSYFPQADFFTEFERFDRHLYKLNKKGKTIDYVSICSPNYLHDAHTRFALRIGADAICEKPLVINPWNLDDLKKFEKETSKKIFTILQLRLHPSVVALKKMVEESPADKVFDVDLTYITPRGNWYPISWKGDEKKSGGIVYNIGIHFFDMLLWIFGSSVKSIVHYYSDKQAAGYLELKKARVRWYLSLNSQDLRLLKIDNKTFRSINIDGEQMEFSDGFTDLHTLSYQAILDGKGWGVDDVESSINMAYEIRHSSPIGLEGEYHPLAYKIFKF